MNAQVLEFARDRANKNVFEIVYSNASLGAYVEGIDLRDPLSPGIVAGLRAALVEHKVLFFRNQDITHYQHKTFGRYFGEIEGHPVTGHVPGHPEILSIRNGEYAYLNALTIPFIRATNKWHADVTFRPNPSLGGVLRARQIPARGGDTLFADMEAIYADLTPDLRAKLDGLTATHDILKSYGWKLNEEEKAALSALHPPHSHPVVRVHQESGRRSIFVNHGFTTKID